MGEISFPSKVPEFLHVVFNCIGKQHPVFFLMVCSLFLRNKCKKTQFSKLHLLEILLNGKQKKHYYFIEQQRGSLFIVYPTEP